jgi:hypothetical protein
MTFKQIMKAKEAWEKANDREVKLRHKYAKLKKYYDLPRGAAKVEEYDGKQYVVTADSTYWDRKLIITEVTNS